jgi:hypothetical protein
MSSFSSKHASLASPRRSQVVTTGNLSHRPPEDIAGGVDVAIVTPPAPGTLPLPFIEPQLIEHVPVIRVRLARGVSRRGLQNHPSGGIPPGRELAADLPVRPSWIARGSHPRPSALTLRSAQKTMSTRGPENRRLHCACRCLLDPPLQVPEDVIVNTYYCIYANHIRSAG